MRFLVDVHQIGARQTGNETWIRNIARELVVLSGEDKLEFTALRSARSEVSMLIGSEPTLVSDSSLQRLAIDLPRVARRGGADACLVQYTMPLSRVPAVVMVHDLSAFDPAAGQWLPKGFRIRVQASIRTAAQRAAILLAPSEFTRRQLVEHLGVAADRVMVAHNAVDPALRELLEVAPRWRAEGDTFRVLAVGNVLPRKNLGVAAHAVARLQASGVPAVLRVVGSIPEQGRVIAEGIRRLLGDSVSFTGYVDARQLAAEYVNADVLAFPSLFEGFGIPALEAMCAGLPVLVSDSTSLPEVVGEAGVVVGAQDVDAWLSVLRRMRDDTEFRRAMQGAGPKRAMNFTWRESANSVLSALRAAAKRSAT